MKEEEGHLRFAVLRVKKWQVQGSESPGEESQGSRPQAAGKRGLTLRYFVQ